MRDIKFRCWNIEQSKMFDWGILSGAKQEAIWIWFDANKAQDNNILMQFTGLKDKNGVEIYEGDMIAEIDKIEELEKWGDPLVVEFGEYLGDRDSWGIPYCTTGFYLRYKDGQMTGIHNRGTAYGFESKDIMIVGNIHQNPELL